MKRAGGFAEAGAEVIKENNGLLQDIGKAHVNVKSCTALLNKNLARRNKR